MWIHKGMTLIRGRRLFETRRFLEEIRLLFHDGGPYHIETSPLICRANQCTGLYMIGTSVMKELNSPL